MTTMQEKLREVNELIDQLAADLQTHQLSQDARDATLEELKILGRDPRGSDPIFTRRGVEILTKHAFAGTSVSTTHAALRCLANTLTLRAETRQMFVDLGYSGQACEQLKGDTWDDEFLVSRIIFLTTYGTTLDVLDLLNNHGLAVAINNKLSRHSERCQGQSNGSVGTDREPLEEMALVETLKLFFNIIHFVPAKRHDFGPAFPHLVELLLNQQSNSSKPLEPPVGQLINALASLEISCADVKKLTPNGSQSMRLITKLLALLDASLRFCTEQELEAGVTPLINVFSRLYEVSQGDIKILIQTKLLPSEEDRKEALGKSSSLPSRLLSTSRNPATSELWKSVSHLYFELSDKDATSFVRNVGYGFASGFLFQNGIPLPAEATQSSNNIAANSNGRAVNPITGQFLDLATEPDVPEMTQEEKEREAERLFVLFERLRNTGIVNVENPVVTAMREGRYGDHDNNGFVEELD